MSLYRDVAVVLRTMKLGEADRIVTLFTRGHGIVRAVAKGVRRTSSKFGARLEPFMVVDLQFFAGRTLDTITQAVTLGPFGAAISAEYERYQAGNVIAEVAERLGEGDVSPQQFELLAGAIRTLAQGKIPAGLVRDGYLLRALSLAGWTPSLQNCVVCGEVIDTTQQNYFSIPGGGIVCPRCKQPGLPQLSSGALHLLRALLAGDWESALAADTRSRQQAAGVVAAYVQFQLERGLRSLRGSAAQ